MLPELQYQFKMKQIQKNVSASAMRVDLQAQAADESGSSVADLIGVFGQPKQSQNFIGFEYPFYHSQQVAGISQLHQKESLHSAAAQAIGGGKQGTKAAKEVSRTKKQQSANTSGFQSKSIDKYSGGKNESTGAGTGSQVKERQSNGIVGNASRQDSKGRGGSSKRRQQQHDNLSSLQIIPEARNRLNDTTSLNAGKYNLAQALHQCGSNLDQSTKNIKGLDQHMSKAQSNERHPVFSPKASTQANSSITNGAQITSFSNYLGHMSSKNAKAIPSQRKPASHFFNQTTSLVGLSSHNQLNNKDASDLSGLEEDMVIPLNTSASLQGQAKKPKANGNASSKKIGLKSGSSTTKANQSMGREAKRRGQEQFFSETQHINLSSLNLVPLYQNYGGSHQMVIPVSAADLRPAKKKASNTLERSGPINLQFQQNCSSGPLGNEYSALSSNEAYRLGSFGNAQVKGSSNQKQTMSQNLNQTQQINQARLDELINHVKAAAASAAVYQTSYAVASTSSSAQGNPINQAPEKTLGTQSSGQNKASFKRKPSAYSSKKHLIPAPAPTAAHATIEVKKLSVKQPSLPSSKISKQKAASSIRDSTKANVSLNQTQNHIEMSSSTKRQSNNVTATSGSNSNVPIEQNSLQAHLSAQTSLQQALIMNADDYKNMTQHVVGVAKDQQHHHQQQHSNKKARLLQPKSLNNSGIQQVSKKKSTSAKQKLFMAMQSTSPVPLNQEGSSHNQPSTSGTNKAQPKPKADTHTAGMQAQTSSGNDKSQVVMKKSASIRRHVQNQLNQTQAIPSQTTGVTTAKNKNQKSFAFEAAPPVSGKGQLKHPPMRRPSAKGAQSQKKLMNLSGTVPKGLLSPSYQAAEKSTRPSKYMAAAADPTNYFMSDQATFGLSNHQQHLLPSQQQHAPPLNHNLPTNLRNPAIMMAGSNGNNGQGGINGNNLQCQNLIYSDMRDYNVINTFIGCFPFQQMHAAGGQTHQSEVGQVINQAQNIYQKQAQGEQEMKAGAPFTMQQNFYSESQQVPHRSFKDEPVIDQESHEIGQLPQRKKRNDHQKTASTIPFLAANLLNELLQNNPDGGEDVPQIVEAVHQSKTAGLTPRVQQKSLETHKQAINAMIKQALIQLPKVKNSSGSGQQQVNKGNPSEYGSTGPRVKSTEFYQQDISHPSDIKNRTAKLVNIGKILTDDEIDKGDIQITSGCGVISARAEKEQMAQILRGSHSTAHQKSQNKVAFPSPKAISHVNQQVSLVQQKFQLNASISDHQKLKRRQLSRSNGSSSNSCDSPSRSMGRTTVVDQDPSMLLSQLQFPITPAKALKLFMNQLTDHEKGEILDYKQVYYLGIGAKKIKGSPQQPYNFGYDDERGDYKVVLQDHIGYKFEVIEFLGKGSFGQALKCFDHKTKEFVAVKLIRNKKRFQHQAGVELKILMHLKQNDPDDAYNIILIKDYVVFRKHLVISFELFSINLYEFIKNNNFQGVNLSLIRRFAIQILQALKYLREQNVIHCDLKPENILLKSPDKSGIKVIDFGSSCFQDERIYTYIQSRFYRAPEIILGIPYTPAIDMWSFGCIMVELFTGYPIFPGENEQEQLSLIMELIGLPPDFVLDQSTRRKIFFDDETDEPLLVTTDSRGKLRIPGSKTLRSSLLPGCQSESFLDFIERCLDWDPLTRITPYEALLHEWIIEGLPPKVLLHHKRMLGVYEEAKNPPAMISGMPKRYGAEMIKQKVKEKVLNKTCQITDVLKHVSDEASTKTDKNSEKTKSFLNNTGVVLLKDKEDLLNLKQPQPGTNDITKKLAPISNPSNLIIQNLPQIIQNNKHAGPSSNFLGDREKSKTTNMAEFFFEMKKNATSETSVQDGDHPHSQNQGKKGAASIGPSVTGRIKFDNTYDISKLKKGAKNLDNIEEAMLFASNQEEDNEEDLEAALIPFDEREKGVVNTEKSLSASQNKSSLASCPGTAIVAQTNSNLKKQQKTKLPFSFLMHNYLKTKAGKDQLEKQLLHEGNNPTSNQNVRGEERSSQVHIQIRRSRQALQQSQARALDCGIKDEQQPRMPAVRRNNFMIFDDKEVMQEEEQ